METVLRLVDQLGAGVALLVIAVYLLLTKGTDWLMQHRRLDADGQKTFYKDLNDELRRVRDELADEEQENRRLRKDNRTLREDNWRLRKQIDEESR